MAQSMTFTYLDANESDVWRRQVRVKVLQVDWVSDGAADPLPGESAGTTAIVNGVLDRAVFIPGVGGVQPAVAYDATVEDAYGADLLIGQGANLNNAVVDHRPVKTAAIAEDSYYQTAINGTLHVHLTACGNDKEGQIFLFFYP